MKRTHRVLDEHLLEEAVRLSGERTYAEADRHLQQALTTFGQCRAMFEAARTHIDLAVARAKRGDVDGARADLATAIAAFDAANAPRRAVHAREHARWASTRYRVPAR